MNNNAVCINKVLIDRPDGDIERLQNIKELLRRGNFLGRAVDAPIFKDEEETSFIVEFGSNYPPVGECRRLVQEGFTVEVAYFNPFFRYGGVILNGRDKAWNFPKENDYAGVWPTIHPLFETRFPTWREWFDNIPERERNKKVTRRNVLETAKRKDNVMPTETINRPENSGRHWDMIRKKWPQFNAIHTVVRLLPDISKRYGRAYCRSEWYNGPLRIPQPNKPGMSIPELGIYRATLAVMQANKVPYTHVPDLVAKLMPACTRASCADGCTGSHMPTTTGPQFEES
jgi:hypothetical protein